jgi:hypothetical protein
MSFLHWFLKSASRISGYRCATIGNCDILAPLNKLPSILQGFVYLQNIDPEMYERLIAKNQFVFCYEKKLPFRFKKPFRFREIYTITDNDLSWGNEGVAVRLVQSVLRNALSTNFVKGSEEYLAASLKLHQQIFEWARNHSLPSELVEHYKIALDKMSLRAGPKH